MTSRGQLESAIGTLRSLAGSLDLQSRLPAVLAELGIAHAYQRGSRCDSPAALILNTSQRFGGPLRWLLERQGLDLRDQEDPS